MAMSHPLERFYPYLPLWGQNLGISLFGWTWRRERLGGRFDEYVAEFAARDRWPVDQMQDHVEQQLRMTLLRAFAHVPYYRRTWRDAGIRRGDLGAMTLANLPQLPVTPKEALRAEPEEFVDRQMANGQKLHRYESSGSTGTPVTAICTADDHRRFIAAREVRSFGWAGASIRQSRSTVGGRLVVPRGEAAPPYYRYNFVEHQVYFSAYHIAPATVGDYVRGFNRYRPQLLTGYAHSHYQLAQLMREQGLTLDYQPAALVLSSEKLTEPMKTALQQAFGARAFEEYGAVENCVLATECERGSLHVSPDFGVLEIVDDSDQPVGPEVDGRVLGTSLLNETQPLIRYELGDRAVWSAQECPCGRRQLPVLEEIVGRLEDIVVAPDGRALVRFHWVFLGLPNIREGQILQEAIDRLTVRLVVTPAYRADTAREIRRRFAERLGPIHVQVEIVPAIPRTTRGKFRSVLSRLSAEEKRQVMRRAA